MLNTCSLSGVGEHLQTRETSEHLRHTSTLEQIYHRVIPLYISVYAVLYILQSTSLISVIIDSRVEGVPVLLLDYLWCDKKYLKVQNCIDY